MTCNFLTDRQSEIIQLYKELGSQRKVAEKLKISRRTVRDSLERSNKKLTGSPDGFKPVKITTGKNGELVSAVHKPDNLIEDEIREGKIIRRSTLYASDGSVTGEWVIRQPETEAVDHTIRTVLEELKNDIPREYSSNKHKEGKRLALINIVDDHMNMRSYKGETGVNWDINKAYDFYLSKFEELLNSMAPANECIIANLGDQFHSNDHMKVTPESKHMLDTDTTYAKAAGIVVKLNRERISLAEKKFGSVRYIIVPGNHDYDASVLLYEVLKAIYEYDENVTVEFAESGVHVEKYGLNMLAFDHGNKGNPERLSGFIANEFRDTFGKTNYRYIHTGHIHKESSIDTMCGFLWRSHRTLTPKDKYAYSNKYTSKRSIKGFIYHKELGEISSTTCNV